MEISTDPERLDVELIHHWLSTDAYWALGRSRETVERSIEHSLNIGAYDGPDQVGYARVVTDQATFAWLCDVYVDPGRRGSGIGTALLDAVAAELAPHAAEAGAARHRRRARHLHQVRLPPAPRPGAVHGVPDAWQLVRWRRGGHRVRLGGDHGRHDAGDLVAQLLRPARPTRRRTRRSRGATRRRARRPSRRRRRE